MTSVTLKDLISNLPAMYVQSRRRRGFIFNLLLVGDSGIGKSTLLANIFNDNSLYQISEQKQSENDTKNKNLDDEVPPDFEDSDISEKSEKFELSEDAENSKSENDKSVSETVIYEVPEILESKPEFELKIDSIHEPNKSAKIQSSKHILTSKNNLQITLNVFEVKNFNESMENKTQHSIAPIIEFLEARLYQDFNSESKPKRCIKEMESQVHRIHTCLYLIPAIYRPLRAIDLAAFKGLHLVPIIPVVARSDALTTYEKTEFQTRLNQEITANQLNLFHTSAFYTICSLEQKRNYQWGASLINNPAYSDLTKLRQFLLEDNLLNLIDSSTESCYHPFREKILKKAGFTESISENLDNIVESGEIDKTELKNSFIMKVKASEAELQRQNEVLILRNKRLEGKMKADTDELNRQKKHQEALEQSFLVRQNELMSFMKQKKLGNLGMTLTRDQLGSVDSLNTRK